MTSFETLFVMPKDLFGIIIYRWDFRSQNLLLNTLSKSFRALRLNQKMQSLWFERYDIRGPHLLFLIGLPPLEFDSHRRGLARRIHAFLHENTGFQKPKGEEIQQRHSDCRSRFMCSIDHLPGLASNDTFFFFQQKIEEHRFYQQILHPKQEQIWPVLTNICFWSLTQVSAKNYRPLVAGLQWIRLMDEVLFEVSPSQRREYWRFQASKLLPGVEAPKIEENIERLIGPKNIHSLQEAWTLRLESPPLKKHLRDLIQISLLTNDEIPSDNDFSTNKVIPHRFSLLREISHAVLRQLGLPVTQQLPLILYTWYRQSVAEAS